MDERGLQAFVADHVRPHALAADRDGQFAPDLLERIGAAGLWGWNIAAEYGGGGHTLAECGALHRQVGAACSSARALLTAHQMTAAAIQRWGNAAQKARWLTDLSTGRALAAFALSEAGAGSDLQGIEARAEAVPDGFVIDGEKKWITGGAIASVFLVFARCGAAVEAFLVPRAAAGVAVCGIPPMLGLRAAMLADVSLRRTKVASDARLGPADAGFRFVAPAALEFGRAMVGFGCLGMALACLREATEHAHTRRAGGTPLVNHQLVQGLLAEMVTAVRTSDALLAKAIALIDARDAEAGLAVLVAKYQASQAAVSVSRDAVQILGARGCAADSLVQRFYRDAKITEIIEGSNEVLKGLIARQAGLML